MALVVAIGVAMVVLIIGGATMTAVTTSAVQASDHVAQVAAEEASLSGVYATEGVVQADLEAADTVLPCTLSGTVPGASTTESWQTSVTYFQALSSSNAPLEPLVCSNGEAQNDQVVAVGILSTGASRFTGTGNGSTEVVWSLDQVNDLFAGGYGVYVNASATFDNSFTTESTMGSVYVNGSANCENATSIAGDLVVNGPFTMTNDCTIHGSLATNGDTEVTTSGPVLDGQASIVGNLTFTNPGAPGPQFRDGAVVSGTAATTDDQPLSTNVAGTLEQGVTVQFPPAPPFPQVDWNEAAWEQAGYRVVQYTDTSNCGSYYGINAAGLPSHTSGVYADLFAANQLTSPEVLYSTCPIDLYGNVTISIGAPFAIVDPAGFDFSNQTTFQSTTSTTERLELIVPSCSSGCSGEVVFSNLTTFGTSTNPLQTLIYTPNQASFSNSLSVTGQVVIGSTGALQNQVNFNLDPFVDVPGTSNQVISLTPVQRYVTQG